MMNTKERYELIRNLSYFWEEKGDITRLSSFNEADVMREFPEVMQAWKNYKHAELSFDLILKNTYDKVDAQFEEES